MYNTGHVLPTKLTSLINTRGLIDNASLENHHNKSHNSGSHKWPKTFFRRCRYGANMVDWVNVCIRLINDFIYCERLFCPNTSYFSPSLFMLIECCPWLTCEVLYRLNFSITFSFLYMHRALMETWAVAPEHRDLRKPLKCVSPEFWCMYSNYYCKRATYYSHFSQNYFPWTPHGPPGGMVWDVLDVQSDIYAFAAQYMTKTLWYKWRRYIDIFNQNYPNFLGQNVQSIAPL